MIFNIFHLIVSLMISLNLVQKSFKLKNTRIHIGHPGKYESLENIYKHQDIIADDFEHVPQFTMEQCNESFCISASNSIMNHKITALKEKLDKVNSLDKNGLKDLYKSTILSGNVSPKGGAGLGIINIAKVSENKISYAFKKLSDTHSYFTLKVTISHNNNK